MMKAQINPHSLVDRLEKKYQKKTRFQIYKDLAQHFQGAFLGSPSKSQRHLRRDKFYPLDYEYTEF